MNPIIRNILIVIAGFVLGSIVNMGIIQISGSIIPPPEGVDPTNMESLKATMHLYSPIHFLFPFLAHALGTLAGAYIAAKLASSIKMIIALTIGILFLLGGISMVTMLPAPIWFSCIDLIFAYLPMAWFGGVLAMKGS
ncbi:MAG: hypothetical protein MK207_01835 [Saprospiraceae bacterium]|nr:hypothetical protein [Saprospiraceae bacterium]